MIKCKKEEGCAYGHCCCECDGFKSQGGQCAGCELAEELGDEFEYNRERILQECEYAVEE